MLECPICKGYMSPPIYQCLGGHTFCANCKTKNETCSTCKEKIENTRNYSLEELSKKVELPSDEKKVVKAETPVKRSAEEAEVNGDGSVVKVLKK